MLKALNTIRNGGATPKVNQDNQDYEVSIVFVEQSGWQNILIVKHLNV